MSTPGIDERPEALAHASQWHQVVVFHEAGHVVGAHVLGLPIEHVTLDYGFFSLAGGHVRLKESRLNADPEADVVMTYAGFAAELAFHERYGGTPDDSGAQSDFEMARQALARCGLTEAQGRARAGELVGQHWEQVTSVATRLLRQHRLSAAQTKRTIRSA